MISSEASASELAISSAITPAPRVMRQLTGWIRPPRRLSARLLPQKALHAALERLRRDPTAGATDHNFSPPCRADPG